MKFQHIIGADLSKKTIDLVIAESRTHLQIKNTPAGFRQMIRWFGENKIDSKLTLIVMEHTGLYSYCFEDFLHLRQIAFTKVNALAIKHSVGMVRGKTDKVDAGRIAAYGSEKRDQLKVQPAGDKALKRLQMLVSTRDRLVRQRTGLSCAVKEYRNIGIDEKDLLIESQLQLIDMINKQVEQLETEMQSIMEGDSQLKQNFLLLQSIKGVGKILAMATIIKTNNFKNFPTARKFACYCGTAPFEHTSGSSIKKRTRVSHLADKQMKTLLDLAAKTAIQYDKEQRVFYLRRVEAGKSKMSTINIVRNKIIYRMFAVIKRQTPFIENYLNAA